mmetsp:Transcript_11147/g.20156  ORF Transcript_11147/g.20156 Transcript_11147/m.20156 type:complete len:208 (-) Transcript_11147:144-767(-)
MDPTNLPAASRTSDDLSPTPAAVIFSASVRLADAVREEKAAFPPPIPPPLPSKHAKAPEEKERSSHAIASVRQSPMHLGAKTTSARSENSASAPHASSHVSARSKTRSRVIFCWSYRLRNAGASNGRAARSALRPRALANLATNPKHWRTRLLFTSLKRSLMALGRSPRTGWIRFPDSTRMDSTESKAALRSFQLLDPICAMREFEI